MKTARQIELEAQLSLLAALGRAYLSDEAQEIKLELQDIRSSTTPAVYDNSKIYKYD